MALMILVNNPGTWSAIYPPLKHAPWHGATATDMVFPFFLFAVGNAMAFVLPRLMEEGDRAFWKKTTNRLLWIFGIGLFLNWSPFYRWMGEELVFKQWVDPTDPTRGIRIMGVLQRIAIAYFFGMIIAYFTSQKMARYWTIGLLVGYWILVWFAGQAGDPYGLHGFIGTKVDLAILHVPHMYKGEGVPFDPEGIVSSITPIAQVLIGYFTGRWIVELGRNYEMLSKLLLMGVVLTGAGLVWDQFFPINKKIWTSSYVLYTSGIAMMVIGVVIYLIEFRGMRGAWSRFCDVFGKNPLFIFVLSGFLPRVLGLIRWQTGVSASGDPTYTSPLPWIYHTFFEHLSSDLRFGSLIYALFTVGFYWFLAWILDRNKIYIKV